MGRRVGGGRRTHGIILDRHIVSESITQLVEVLTKQVGHVDEVDSALFNHLFGFGLFW